MSYQTFDDKVGASRSAEKLEALKLPDLTGKTVLDLGCNEGFFCFAALERGASRVVGIDKNPAFLDGAKRRAQALGVEDRAEFHNQSWDDLPEGVFDVILLTSALHYAADQEAFIARIAEKLSPGGLFVFEGGVTNVEDAWTPVERGPKTKRTVVHYPNRRQFNTMCKTHFAVRLMGKSVKQSGDPIPRFVYHCTKLMRTVLCLEGRAKAGKTTLAGFLGKKGIPVLATDAFLKEFVTGSSDVSKAVLAHFVPGRLAMSYKAIVEAGLGPDLARAIADELEVLAPDQDLVLLEGALLRHREFSQALSAELSKRFIVQWNAIRAV